MRSVNNIVLCCLLVVSFLFTSCLGEDNDTCPPVRRALTIRFLHDINPYFEDRFASLVEFVDLYIYDSSSSTLVEHCHISNDQLTENNYIYTQILAPGSYELVALMNAGDSYEIGDTDGIDDGFFRLLCNDNYEISENTPSVYFVRSSVELDRAPVETTLNFVKNTNHIRVETGFNRLIPDYMQFDVRITGYNSICDFTNICHEESPLYTYFPYDTTITRAVQTNAYSFTTQRLWENDGLTLTITKQETGRENEVLVSVPLTHVIMENPLYNSDTQLERFDTYRVYFEFEYKNGTWVVTAIIVDDWKLVNIESILK